MPEFAEKKNMNPHPFFMMNTFLLLALRKLRRSHPEIAKLIGFRNGKERHE